MKFFTSVILTFCLLLSPSVSFSAALSPTVANLRTLGLCGEWTVTWGPLTTTNNTCTAYTAAYRFSSMTVQVTGTWGGATITFQGSNDGSTWFNLKNVVTLADLSLTANGVVVLVENVKQIKGVLSGGDGTTSLTIIVLCRN